MGIRNSPRNSAGCDKIQARLGGAFTLLFAASCFIACGPPLPLPDPAAGNTQAGESASSTPESSAADRNEPACVLGPSHASFATLVNQRCESLLGCCDADEIRALLGLDSSDRAQCSRRMMQALHSSQIDPLNAARLGQFDPALASILYMSSVQATELRSGCLSACLDVLRSKGCKENSQSARCEHRNDYPGGPCDLHLLLRGTLEQGAICEAATLEAGLDTQCKYGLDCMPRSDGSYRCTPVGTLNQSCSLRANSRKGSCEHDLVCHPKLLRCLRGGSVGESCEHEDPERFAGCRPGLECGHEKRCVPPCQAGARCADERGQSDDRLCPSHFSCYPGRVPYCNPLNAQLAHCDSDQDCGAHRYCSSARSDSPLGAAQAGQCLARMSQGSCERDRQCDEGSYCASTRRCAPKLGLDQNCKGSSACSPSSPICASVDRDAQGKVLPLAARCVQRTRATQSCIPKDPTLLDAPKLDGLRQDAVLRVQNEDAPWLSVCQQGGCERTQSQDQASCQAYAALGAACDHIPGGATPSCAPDTHCVAGRCSAFVPNGENCDPASEQWRATDAALVNGFPSKLCNPRHSRCVAQGNGSGLCLVDAKRSAFAICDGG